MPKLIFNYGCMAAGKSSTLLIKAYQFRQNGKRVQILRPSVDTRTESGKVSSRIGIKAEALCVSREAFIADVIDADDIDILLVDESNFFTVGQIEQLADLVDTCGLQVMCFGLMSDFEGKLFDSSKRLVELANRLDEQVSMCEVGGCGKKATMHIRLTAETEQFVCGDDIYKSVCRKCWKRLTKEKATC